MMKAFQQVGVVKPFKRTRCDDVKKAHIITQGPAPVVIVDCFCRLIISEAD